MKPKVICILGMHRTGTSMITKLLNICGVYIGEGFVPPDKGNPKGHWEPIELGKINKRILRVFGGNWENPPAFPENWENNKSLDGLYKKAKIFVKKMNKQGSVWAFKDPRVCLTLPFWKKVIPEMVLVITYRDKDSVIKSLVKRNKMDKRKAAFLFDMYWDEIIFNTKGERKFFTFYNNYFTNWKEELTAVLNFLNFKEIDLLGKEEEINKFIIPKLRHFVSEEKTSFLSLKENAKDFGSEKNIKEIFRDFKELNISQSSTIRKQENKIQNQQQIITHLKNRKCIRALERLKKIKYLVDLK